MNIGAITDDLGIHIGFMKGDPLKGNFMMVQ